MEKVTARGAGRIFFFFFLPLGKGNLNLEFKST